jgi:hypothetical protein
MTAWFSKLATDFLWQVSTKLGVPLPEKGAAECPNLALNVICCKTALRLKLGGKAEIAGARSKRR